MVAAFLCDGTAARVRSWRQVMLLEHVEQAPVELLAARRFAVAVAAQGALAAAAWCRVRAEELGTRAWKKRAGDAAGAAAGASDSDSSATGKSSGSLAFLSSSATSPSSSPMSVDSAGSAYHSSLLISPSPLVS